MRLDLNERIIRLDGQESSISCRFDAESLAPQIDRIRSDVATLRPHANYCSVIPRLERWRQPYKSFNESVFRRADLLYGSAIHDDDPVGESHGFDLIMRDVTRRNLESALQMLDLNARCPAQLRIQVRKRLVHRERARMPDDRPRQGRALTLAMLSTSNASPRHPEKRDAPSQRLVNSDSEFSARHQSAAIRGHIEFWV